MYLGGFATEDEAARAYDLAAIGCKGPSAEINFHAADYADTMTSDLAGLSRVKGCLLTSASGLGQMGLAVWHGIYACPAGETKKNDGSKERACILCRNLPWSSEPRDFLLSSFDCCSRQRLKCRWL